MYAVIRTGGKQYRVAVGDVIEVEKLSQDSGGEVAFEEVLMVASDGGIEVGRPLVAKARVTAEVVEQFRGPKILTFKHKKRKNYRKTIGHRQNMTKVRIKEIAAG